MKKSIPARKEVIPTGIQLLHDNHYNKGTAFSLAERQALAWKGCFLPPFLLLKSRLSGLWKIFEKRRLTSKNIFF